MKQKTVILLMFVAFLCMWACTPSSLRRDNKKELSKAVGDLSLPDDVPLDTLVQKVKENVPDAIADAVADAVAENVPEAIPEAVAEALPEGVEEAAAEAVREAVADGTADSLASIVAEPKLIAVFVTFAILIIEVFIMLIRLLFAHRRHRV